MKHEQTDALNAELFAAVEGMEGAARVRELLSAGACANARSRGGSPILWWAVAFDEPDAEVVRALLEAGADPNAAEGCDASYTALAAARESGADEETLRLLLSAGARDEPPEWEGEPCPPDKILPPEEDAAATRELLIRAGSATPLSESVLREYLQRDAGMLSAALREALVWAPKPSVVRLLLSAGADPNATDAAGNTALHKALEYKALAENVELLLQAGADPRIRNARGYRPRDYARAAYEAVSPPQQLIQILLRAEKTSLPPAMSPDLTQQLFEALRDGKAASCAQRLIREGAQVNARRLIRSSCRISNGQFSLLDYALSRPDTPPEVVSDLLAAGAAPTDRSLALAVDSERRICVIDSLLRAGANPNGRDERGLTPLMHAAISGDNIRMYLTLLEAGALPNMQDSEDMTVLHHILDSGNPVNARVLRMLIYAGADPNIADTRGITPLMYAMHHTDTYCDLASILLAAGADVHARDTKGRTPLHHAWGGSLRPHSPALVQDIHALLIAGADLHARDHRGYTPLDRMIAHGDNRPEVLQLIHTHERRLLARRSPDTAAKASP